MVNLEANQDACNSVASLYYYTFQRAALLYSGTIGEKNGLYRIEITLGAPAGPESNRSRGVGRPDTPGD
jgi:hypothetical protein